MIEQLKIGPVLTICSRETYLPTIVDAFLADNERGSHALNNEYYDKLKMEWPTLIPMASLIEQQRDALLVAIKDIIKSHRLDTTNQLNDLDDAKAVVVRVEKGQC